jgi:hypothetical protein
MVQLHPFVRPGPRSPTSTNKRGKKQQKNKNTTAQTTPMDEETDDLEEAASAKTAPMRQRFTHYDPSDFQNIVMQLNPCSVAR